MKYETHDFICTISKDYDVLYKLLCQGMGIVAFVNYGTDENGSVLCRGMCKIERRGDWDIDFGVRGMGYDRLYSKRKEVAIDEITALKMECVRMNVEYIIPTKQI